MVYGNLFTKESGLTPQYSQRGLFHVISLVSIHFSRRGPEGSEGLLGFCEQVNVSVLEECSPQQREFKLLVSLT